MNEKYIYVGIAVVVALGIVAFAYATKPACTDPAQTQIKFCNGDLGAIGAALSAPKLVIEAYYPVEQSSYASCQIKAMAEVIYQAASIGKVVETYQNVNNSYCIDSNNSRVPCPTANMIFKQGDCNCIKTIAAENRIEITGNEDFFCNNSAKIGAAVAAALNKK